MNFVVVINTFGQLLFADCVSFTLPQTEFLHRSRWHRFCTAAAGIAQRGLRTLRAGSYGLQSYAMRTRCAQTLIAFNGLQTCSLIGSPLIRPLSGNACGSSVYRLQDGIGAPIYSKGSPIEGYFEWHLLRSLRYGQYCSRKQRSTVSVAMLASFWRISGDLVANIAKCYAHRSYACNNGMLNMRTVDRMRTVGGTASVCISELGKSSVCSR